MSTAGRLGLKDPKVVDLVMWKDIKKSGAVLGGATLAYFLLELSSFTVIEMIATVLLVLTLATSVWSLVAGYLNKASVPIPAFVTEGISDEVAHKVLIEQCLPHVNKGLAFAAKVAKAEDLKLCGKIAAGLFLVTKAGRFCSIFTILYLGVVLFMSVPKIYDMKHEEIDKMLDQGMTKAKELQKVAEEKLQPMLEKLPKAKAKTEAKSE